jgi:hypothetical protein
MVAGWCVFGDKLADVGLALDLPEKEKGEDYAGAEQVVEDDDQLVELDVTRLA